MPKINLTIPHGLGLEEAKRRISDFLTHSTSRAAGKFTDLERTGSGDVESFRFRAMGFWVAGWFKVQPADLLVELNVPLAALPLKGRVEQEIISQARSILG